jgi:hypothetical protein
VAVGSVSGWNVLYLPATTAAWPRNLYAEPLTCEVDFLGRSSGELLVDDLVLRPYTLITPSNEWVMAVGGRTPFQERDTASWANTETGAIVQRWIRRGYNFYWPHTAGTPTVDEPSITTS